MDAKFTEEVDRPKVQNKARSTISATPYAWPSPEAISPRRWLYGRHLVRGYSSATIASAGVGKTALLIGDALAMASGRDLFDMKPARQLSVWLFNGEDPLEELERRIAAASIEHGVTEKDCGERLFVDSGRDVSLVIARQSRDGLTIMEPVVEAIMEAIRLRKIDVLIVDPFVSCHEVSENDNGAIDKVAKTWARIAHETDCAIELVHHSRKTGGDQVTVEHARGAGALIAAVRSARVLNVMTEDEAARAGIDNKRLLYFSVENGKANLAPPPDGKAWYRIQSVDLGNGADRQGDSVGVVASWAWPDPLAGMSTTDLIIAQKAVALTTCREDSRSPSWAGHVIGEALGIDTKTATGKNKIKGMLAVWVQSGMFKAVKGFDEKRNPRTFLEVAEWADE